MKKTAMLMLVSILLLSAVFSGCQNGGAIDVTNTVWSLESVSTDDGVIIKGDETIASFGEITYTFKENGIVSASMAGATTDGTYEQQDHIVTIKLAGTETITATISGNILSIENGGLKTTFKKK